MAQFSFDPSSVEKREGGDFTLIPAGNYLAQVVESDIRPLKSGNGQALVLVFQIIDGEFNGRKVWNWLSVRHTNPEAERIAQQSLRELCDALGVVRMQDTGELHHKPVTIRVKIREDKSGQYAPQNEVTGYRGATAASPAPAFNRPTTAAAAPAAASTPPWQKKAA